MLAAIVAAGLMGLALTVTGLRGRRVDDHPLCRRCRFDLTGRPADAVPTCPECGADVGGARAIVVGHRRRRPGAALAVGAVLLAVALPAAGVLGWAAATHVNWLRYAPVAYLRREATSADPARRRPAWVELLARRADGGLTAADRDGVADAALAYQADPTQAWDPAVGDWVDDARAAGQLSDARWQRYAAAAWPTALSLRVRPRVRSGDPISYQLDQGPSRVGTRAGLYLELDEGQVTWDDRPDDSGRQGQSTSTGLLSAGGGSSGSSVQPGTYAGHLTVGHHVLRVRAAGRVLPHANSSTTPVATGTVDLSAPFDLLPTDQPTVKLVHDPALADRVRAAVTVDVRHQLTGGYTNVTANVNGTPVGLGFTCLLRSPGPARRPHGRPRLPGRDGQPRVRLRRPLPDDGR